LRASAGLFVAEVKGETLLHSNLSWRGMDVDAMAARRSSSGENGGNHEAHIPAI
jgi:hypothetical protein